MVNNYFPKGLVEICFPWAWYVWVDIQLFVITIPLLYLYSKSKVVSIALIQALTVASLICAYVFAEK